VRPLLFLLLAGCADRPSVVVEDSRDAFFFDRPFPSDELLTERGTVDLTGWPIPEAQLGSTIVGGWARMVGESVHGFSHLGPVYLQLTGPLDVPETTEGLETDDVRLVSLDSGHRPALRLRFIRDPNGDPFYAPNTLVIAPNPTDPLRSGEQYAVVLSKGLVERTEGSETPAGLDDEKRVGFASTFTVQDSIGQLHTLRDATDALLDANPAWLQPTDWREVESIAFAPGMTPSGRDATQFTATYIGGETEVTWLADRAGQTSQTIDLSTDSMRIFEARIQTVAWRPLADLPYATPGIGFLSDFGRSDGRIAFNADGTLGFPGEPEAMRIVIQVPRDIPATAVMSWDHGTAGHAYHAVQQVNLARRSDEIRDAAAAAGVAIVSHDQPLYGQRYPLIDQGFDGSLGFYNIANLPAFRDNQRQGGIDHHVLYRFSTEVLPTLDDVDVTPTIVGAFGHSLGSVTNHIALAMVNGDGADTAFQSGSGGFLANYVVQTGLLGTENDVVELLQGLVEADLPPDPNGSEAVGALMGIPEESWEQVDDMHPVFVLFQMIMDPSDPLALAPDQPVPESFLVGIGDLQVPNITTDWLIDALPDARRTDCQAQSDYDPHGCLFIEDDGLSTFTEWIQGLPQ
jgi:hypothetical protein